MKRQLPAVLVVLLTACGGGGDDLTEPTPRATPTPWPEEYQEWVCAAADELIRNAQPAINDIVDATDLLDVPATVGAADRLGDSAAQARDFLELAPRWGRGNRLVRTMDRWVTHLAVPRIRSARA